MTDEGEDDTPLSESLFSLSFQLCKEFPALSPFEIDRKPFHDVIRLFSDMRRLQLRNKKIKDPNRIVKRQAGDDWF